MLREEYEYRQYTKPAELHKAINTLKGLVSGITADGHVFDNEIKELVNWCDLHRFLSDRHPFNEIIPLVDTICEDHVIFEDEAQDLIWLCNNILNSGGYYDLITSGIQQLEGMLHGLMADGFISDKEIGQLQRWISENEFLKTVYPYDEIDSLVTSVLADSVISYEERNMLTAYFSQFVDTKNSYNLNGNELEELRQTLDIHGICVVDPDIDITDGFFCFTGKSYRSTRNEIAKYIMDKGGKYNDSITANTGYLIIGNAGSPCWAFSCYGRKVEQAIEMRKNGSKILIVHENDFWDCV